MRYLILCCDYDGTLAHHGQLTDATVATLERLIASGRRLAMVTGRELDDLQRVCQRLDLFEYVVAENGALLYRPATKEEKCLAAPPPEIFVRTLRERGVAPVSVGRVIVATWEPHELRVLETIRDLGLELQVIFNKGAVMVLPAGVNKASGLTCALQAMNLSAHNAVGIGDAENDHAFLSLCECAVAVANALPTLKDEADIVTRADHGDGVAELIDEILADDLASREERLQRHHILLGRDDEGNEVWVPPYGANVLLVGTSGSGKSTLATGFMERLTENKYSYCVIDPEGDYEALPGAASLGAADRPPSIDEVLQLLETPDTSCVINLVGLPLGDRPNFFIGLMPRLQELRARTGRPHWIIMDEAHHLLPAEWQAGQLSLPGHLYSVLQISVHPDLIAASSLTDVDTVIAVGKTPVEMLREFTNGVDEPAPQVRLPDGKLESNEALVWFRKSGKPAIRIAVEPGKTERRRHTRKYAQGELGPDNSFYFRGPEGKLNLRAQNLILFLQIADGVDDETWTHHLRAGDYSQWVKENIKDDGLAQKIQEVEMQSALTPEESRQRIREAIEEQYTLPG